jgi:limonene-1,2-epoxide hydrolase
VASDIITMPGLACSAGGECAYFIAVQRRGRVENAVGGEIRIAADGAESGVVLDCRFDPRLPHAVDECGRMLRVAGRVQPEVAVERPDGRVANAIGLHRIGDRSQVDVDAG